MSTLQNFKNFIRHGKQARNTQASHADPTTDVSTVHAHQQNARSQPLTEPNLAAGQVPMQGVHMAEAHSVGHDNRNIAVQGAATAAKATAEGQRIIADAKAGKNIDPQVLERIVAEERESKGKLPKYPGLDRYILVEKMGDGAFSNVYRAKDTENSMAEVAIKVVRKFEMNSSQRANILKEVQIMRQLDHPNIVKLVDFSESRQYYFIVLELCPGGELFHQIVRLTYFSEELSRHVIVQVAKALEYLHEESGVVHRDIKPENLLFYPTPFVPTRTPKPKGPEDEDKADEGEFIPGIGSGGIGQIKIADFGLSKVIWDSQTMTPCGTVGYTAPEIVKDERYSKSVDMWALGCVLYTLLCGFPPFYDESIQILTEKVARGQYTFLSPWWDDISKPAKDLVSHLLTVDPDKRYSIQQFLDHPWIRQTNEDTHAAADAPPLSTPSIPRSMEMGANQFQHPQESTVEPQQSGQTAYQQQLAATFLESPGVGNRPMDFRSPGAINLREVFDVSYAVHRQEEEGKRRKNYPQGYRGFAPNNALNDLDEDEYEEGVAESGSGPAAKLAKPRDADVGQVEQGLRNTNLAPVAGAPKQSAAAQARQQARGYGQHSPQVAQAVRQSQQKQKKGPFELSLDNATLLGRRGKGTDAKGGSKLREQVVQ
ncbi:MAG: hypothetical protein M1814_005850 [Vezdaea aestivalis]|nr:MAG: hypothetical protein M1814_005850 [Vezdaea aestivalis]